MDLTKEPEKFLLIFDFHFIFTWRIELILHETLFLFILLIAYVRLSIHKLSLFFSKRKKYHTVILKKYIKLLILQRHHT